MYRKGDKYITKSGRTYFFILSPGAPDVQFTMAVQTYCNALINSNGGILVFGVDHNEQIAGFQLSRAWEDLYKLNFDSVIKQMRPTIHPHQYRFDVVYLTNCPLALFEIRMSAGEPEEIYENSRHEVCGLSQMFIVKEKKLYGPLIPCEITQIVLAKYKEELSTLMENNQRQITSHVVVEHNDKTTKETETQATKRARTKWDKITWP